MHRTAWYLKCSLHACDRRPEEGRPAQHALFLHLPLSVALCFSKLLDQFIICETGHLLKRLHSYCLVQMVSLRGDPCQLPTKP